MIDILWSPRAEADLKEIRAFMKADSPAWADLTLRRLVAAVERLREFPDSGRMVPERQSPELREVVSGNLRIVSRRASARIEIATVLRNYHRPPRGIDRYAPSDRPSRVSGRIVAPACRGRRGEPVAILARSSHREIGTKGGPLS